MSPHAVNGTPWLSLVLFLPLAAALVLQLFPRRAALAIKSLTVATTLAVVVLVAALLVNFDASSGGAGTLPMQYQERHDWLPAIGTSYHLGIDGLSGWLLALNAGLFFIAALWVNHRSTERMKLFCGLLLLSETATAGVLLSTDLLLFYLFWEAMLIPLYLWLSSYGGPKRGAATLKFVIYTVTGSLFMLVSIIYLYLQTGANGGHPSFDLADALRVAGHAGGAVSVTLPGGASHLSLLLSPTQFAFVGFAIAFLVKTPIVPFHTWLPDLYESAPAAVLVPFAGIVGKLGAFGFLRYCITLFPAAAHSFQFVLAGLGVLTIIYGALMALVQNDIKRLVAYASLSHLGFILVGIFSLNGNGVNGAIIQMVNHGIIIAGLFLVVAMIETRTGTRDRRELAGLEGRMPLLYVLFLVITLAGLGLPGMNSFVGEFTIMLGAFSASPILAVLAGMGVILAAWYMLRLHQGLMHDPEQPRTETARDLGWGEALVLLPLVGLMLLLGVFPRPVSDLTRQSARGYVSAVQHPQGGNDTATGGTTCVAGAPACSVP